MVTRISPHCGQQRCQARMTSAMPATANTVTVSATVRADLRKIVPRGRPPVGEPSRNVERRRGRGSVRPRNSSPTRRARARDAARTSQPRKPTAAVTTSGWTWRSRVRVPLLSMAMVSPEWTHGKHLHTTSDVRPGGDSARHTCAARARTAARCALRVRGAPPPRDRPRVGAQLGRGRARARAAHALATRGWRASIPAPRPVSC